MESNNNFIKLHKLLSPYQDLIYENWILFRERITSPNGFQIELNNTEPDTLFNILETNNRIESIAGCKYFHFINQGTTGIRTRDNKGILFNNANEYEIIINNKKYIKNDKTRWDSILQKIKAPKNSVLIIKEVKTDIENLESFVEMNFLDSSEAFYYRLNDSVKGDLKNQSIPYVKQLFKKLNFPEKVTKENKEQLVSCFELSRYSLDLGLLQMIEQFAFELMESKETPLRCATLWEANKKKALAFKEVLLKSPLP